jgi:hypothetical protein
MGPPCKKLMTALICCLRSDNSCSKRASFLSSGSCNFLSSNVVIKNLKFHTDIMKLLHML